MRRVTAPSTARRARCGQGCPSGNAWRLRFRPRWPRDSAPMPRRHTPRIWRRKTGQRHRMRGEPVRSARRLPPAKPTQGKQQQRIPTVTTFFRNPFVRDQAARPSRFRRGNMHLSARNELKSELAESRIETKLPINKCGLLHVCLTDVRFRCGRDDAGDAGRPRCAAGAYDQAGRHGHAWVHPDEERWWQRHVTG